MPGIVSPPPPPSPPAPAVVLSEMPAGDVPNNASAAELSWGQQIKRWFNLNFVMPARSLEKLDLGSAILLGFWFGIFPIPGTSTALLGAFLVMFRRSRWTKWCPNAPQSTIALGVNLLCTPLCIGLIPVWLRLGALVSPPRFAGCDPDSIVSAIKASRKLIVKGRAAHPSVVQRRQELARAKAGFEAVRSEKTLVKIRWEHKPQKMLWVSSSCFKGHVLSTPERPAFYLGPMPGFFDGDVMQVVRSVSAHPGLHPTLRPNKLLPPPKVRVLPCIDEGHSVQYPLLSSTAESESITLRNSKEMQAKQDSLSD
ncbi:hypothetical protein FOZ63_020054, partial [Perkinsus olseni]